MKILQVVLALSILIAFHELGHFTFSKLFRIRVEKFYLFFDLGGKFLFSTKKSRWFTRLCPKALDWETEYGIGWLPLGGYCKIAGMIDESMDLESMKKEPRPWELRSHPNWQKLLVMAGGVLFNFILAIVVYISIVDIWGQSFIPNKGSKIYVNALAEEMGFRSGDEILRFDDYAPEGFATLQADLARRNVHKATVLRGADTVDIYIDRNMIGDVLNSELMFDLAVPFEIDSVAAGSPNGAVLVHGDRITAFDSVRVAYLQDARPVLAGMAGSSVTATVERGGETVAVPVEVDSLGRIGVYMKAPEIVRKEYNFWQAVPAGIKLTGDILSGYLKDLRLLATPSSGAYKSVGSFIAIGQVFPAAWDWYRFMYMLALLSVMLGVMNLIPIPGLDGGHILFILVEMISGRKPSDKFMAVMQVIGMILLLALMMLAFGNDIGRLMH
ncbi:MAG: RIP metalloprotease RseP [Bacteroidales bacterium]|nr:RIP metalloprotease RseP [Bacteroidales bacterium]